MYAHANRKHGSQANDKLLYVACICVRVYVCLCKGMCGCVCVHVCFAFEMYRCVTACVQVGILFASCRLLKLAKPSFALCPTIRVNPRHNVTITTQDRLYPQSAIKALEKATDNVLVLVWSIYVAGHPSVVARADC